MVHVDSVKQKQEARNENAIYYIYVCSWNDFKLSDDVSGLRGRRPDGDQTDAILRPKPCKNKAKWQSECIFCHESVSEIACLSGRGIYMLEFYVLASFTSNLDQIVL